MKTKNNTAPKVGACVQYCGHKGSFLADIIEVGNAVVVRASGPVTPGNIERIGYDECDYHLSDFPGPVFWRPDLGVFVVPRANLTKLNPHDPQTKTGGCGDKVAGPVVPAKFGPIGRDINDASGKYVATAYIPEGAAQIAHALNSLPNLCAAAQQMLHSPGIRSHRKLSAALSAAEKGMV